MFEITNKLLVCKSDLFHSFAVPNRLAFKKGGAEVPSEQPAGETEKDKTPEEIDKILNGKEKGVKFDKDYKKTLEDIAKKVYTTKEKQALFVMEMEQALDESVKKSAGPKGDVVGFWKAMETAKCDTVTINKDGKFVFRTKEDTEGKGLEVGQLKPKGVAIDQGPQKPAGAPPAKKPEAPAVPAAKPEAPAAKPEEAKEDPSKTALDQFLKSYPGAKKEQISLSAEKVAAGTSAKIRMSRAVDRTPVLYSEGSKLTMLDENIRKVSATILSPYVIQAPKSDGTMSKFVYIEADIVGIFKDLDGKRSGWIELSTLQKQGQKGSEAVKTESEWTKEPEYTGEKTELSERAAKAEGVLYHNKTGLMIREFKAGDKLNVVYANIRKVGNEEYLLVELNAKGGKDRGWVKRSLVEDKAKAPEVAYKAAPEKKEAAVQKKYYNPDTGKVSFADEKGKVDTKAEMNIKLGDLFPNQKDGDEIVIKAPGDKPHVAKFDAKKGQYYYKNGERAKIYNDYIVLPRWKAEGMAEAPSRTFVEKRVLKPGDTYEALAAEALKMPTIQSTGITAEKYIGLLKKYQSVNTVYFVVPTPEEAGAPTAAEVIEKKYDDKAKAYSEKFKKNREGAEKAMRGDLDKYMKNPVTLRASLLKVVDDDEAFRKAWNGDINSELTGLNKLINVLKHPVFAEAGINEGNAREKIRGLIQEYSNKEVDFEDIVNYLKIYRKRDPLGGADQIGSYSDFKSDLEEYSGIMKKNESGMKAFEAKKGSGILKQTEVVQVVQEKMRLARAQGLDEYALLTKDQAKQYVAATEALSAVKDDPDYKAWDAYRLASSNVGYLNYVLFEGAQLLEALGQLELKEFKSDSAVATKEVAQMAPGTKRSVEMMEAVFKDSEHEGWASKNGDKRKFSWEDVVAGTEQEKDAVSKFNQYFDAYAPVVRTRSKLNKYTNEKGQLDGVERINEADTVKEFNRLMKKSLKRLIAWKKNPKEVMAFLSKYSPDSAATLPGRDKGEGDEAYATRLAPMLTGAVDKAFEKLKVNNFADLETKPDDSPDFKQLVEDRKDLIKMGYYFDSRDEEKGIKEGSEGLESQLSMNPMIRKAQEDAIAQGYPKENIKKVESIFLGGIAIKVDTTKPVKQAIGLGLGTGVDLGDGFTLMVGIGVDSLADHPTPMLGIAIRKGWKLGQEKRSEVGVTVGPGIGLTGPSIGAAVDFTWPISDAWDMKAFAGGSVGVLVAGAGGGIGFAKNFEAAQKNLEKEIGGFDPAEIDKEKDPDKKYMLIINNPQIGAFYRSAAAEFPKLEDQKRVVLDLYEAHRASISSEAADKNTNPIISGFGIAAGFAMIGGVPIPWVGPYLTFTVDKTTYVYRRPSESSKQMDKVSEAEAQRIIMEDVQKKSPKGTAIYKDAKAGESGDVIVDAQGNIAVRKSNYQVDLAPFKDQPNVEKYNEALKPYDMKLVPDGSGLLELQVFGALGNLEIYMDPGMEKKGLILKDGKVYVAPGANPELFITREEFFTPFPKKGYYQNTIITLTDTPKRTRSTISNEVEQSGSYLYRKAGKEWEVISAPNVANGNVMDAAGYQKFKGNFEAFTEKVSGFDETKWKAYEAKINGLPFVKDPEPDLTPDKVKELKSFSSKFLPRRLAQYKELTTVKPTDSEELVNDKRRKLAELIQKDAKEKAPAGIGAALSDLQMNFVMSELMDLSFSELEKAGDKRARFESNLEWSKNAVLLPFFRNKVKELNERGFDIKSTPEQLVDYLMKQLRTNVKDEELGKPGKQLGPNWLFSSVAGAIGTGLRGVPGYISQDKYGVLGLNEVDLTKPGIEGDLAKVILELESPLDRKSEKAMMESPLAKKLISMPGMWFVLGDGMANQAVEGMEKALKGEKVEGNKGYDEFKKILVSLRETQLKGGNVFVYTAENGNTFEFRLDTKVADAAHARCGNASFGVKEGLQIYARIKPGEGMVVAGGKESVATVSPETVTRFISFGIAGVVTIDVGKKDDIPPPPSKEPPKEEPTPGHEGSTGGDMPTGPKPNVPPGQVDTTPTPGGGGTPSDI